MTTKNNHSLESFVERHRADFDVHEPRPDLWAALEQQLDAPAPAVTTSPLLVAASTSAAEDASRQSRRGNWLQRYGIAAALAVLVVAAGVSEAWKSSHTAPEVAAAEPAETGSVINDDDAALYLGAAPQALTAAARSDSNSIQLSAAVRGMEAYYTSQLARRQEELSQLGGPAAAAMAADYQRELAALDSSYWQLKRELPSHPQPEAVLTAMNRNLQIRLDILDQQLHLGTPHETDAAATGSFVLADSRRQP